MEVCYTTTLGIDSGKGIESCAIPYSIGLVALLSLGAAIYFGCRNNHKLPRPAAEMGGPC
jgi:threonine/homoserine efflux transporter RhtA